MKYEPIPIDKINTFKDSNKFQHVNRKGGYHNTASEKQGVDTEGRLGNSV